MGNDKRQQAKAWAEKEGKKVWNRHTRPPLPWGLYVARAGFWLLLIVAMVGLSLHDGGWSTSWGAVWH
jgi:hypothetical protein